MGKVFHIESENPNLIRNSVENAAICYKRQVELKYTKTPYHHLYIAMDFEIIEEDISKFLKVIEELEKTIIIHLYTKEVLVDRFGNQFPYYRPYVSEESFSYLKTTLFYQKLRRGEEFASEYPDAKVYPNFLEYLKIEEESELTVRGTYQSIACTLNNGNAIAEDIGSFEIEGLKRKEGYTLLAKMTNYRKVYKSTETLNNYLFQIKSKQGFTTYQAAEHYIPYDEQTIIHFGEDTKKRELYLKEDGKMKLIPYYKYENRNSLNQTEKTVEEAIETWSRKRHLK